MGWFKRHKNEKNIKKVEKTDFDSFVLGIETLRNNLASKTAECAQKDVDIRKLTNENQSLRNELQKIKNTLKGIIG